MKALWSASLVALCGALGCSAEQDAPGAGGASQAGAGPVSGAAGAAGSSSGGQAQSSAGQSSAGQSSAGQSSAGAPAGGANNGSGGAPASAGSNAAGQSGSTSGGQTAGGAGGASGGSIKLWLAGDSTVMQCSGTCPCGWGSQFDALFDDRVTVVNRGVGGRSVQTWLYEGAVTNTLGDDDECTLSSDSYDKRWRDMLDMATGMKPGDYLFVQFGINDGDRTCPRHVGVEAFKTYLEEIATAAAERGAQAIFVTPVGAIECSGNQAIETRRTFADATKAAATKAGVPLIDLHQASMSLYDSLGFCPNDKDYTKGELGAFFCNDHTHFEAAGAARIAKLVAQALATQVPTLAAYLR